VSSTGRSTAQQSADFARYERHADDFYTTPAWATDAILSHLSPLGRVLDAGCGEGAIMARVGAFGATDVRGVEVHEGRAMHADAIAYTVHGDFLALEDALNAAGEPTDLIIANPPFKLAMEFVQKALALTHGGSTGQVAMLLRLAFLASMKRAAFHRLWPSDVYVLPRRPSFTPDGKTDSTDYAWFVFGPKRGGRWSVLEVPT
jgi:predicted RNA methylase